MCGLLMGQNGKRKAIYALPLKGMGERDGCGVVGWEHKNHENFTVVYHSIPSLKSLRTFSCCSSVIQPFFFPLPTSRSDWTPTLSKDFILLHKFVQHQGWKDGTAQKDGYNVTTTSAVLDNSSILAISTMTMVPILLQGWKFQKNEDK